MSVTQTPPPELAAIESGVIEDARRRQRRRRAIGACFVAAAAAAVVALSFAGGGGGGGRHAAVPSPAPGPRLSFVRGLPYVDGQLFSLAVAPSLRAGDVGLCLRAGCDPYPGPGQPIYGGGYTPEASVGPEGEVDYELVGPQVAAVHVEGLGKFVPVTLPGLPQGDRVVVFYRPPGSRGTVLPAGAPASTLTGLVPGHATAVTVTPLDHYGRALPSRWPPEQNVRPNSYWQPPSSAPANGRCALASHTPGASIQWGQVATAITPDPAATDAQFLSCLQTWFNIPRGAFQAAILLNARHPGRAPGSLWGATPVPGHPGVIKIDARFIRPYRDPRQIAAEIAQATRYRGRAFAARIARLVQQPIQIQPLTVARRVGHAWLLVLNGGNLTQEIQLLNQLNITRLNTR